MMRKNWDQIHRYLLDQGVAGPIEVRAGRVYRLEDLGDIDTLADEAQDWHDDMDLADIVF